MEFGREIIQNALDRRIELLFIDEIGPLELEEKGFHEILWGVLVAPIEIYLVVRKSCLQKVIHKFAITKYMEIKTK